MMDNKSMQEALKELEKHRIKFNEEIQIAVCEAVRKFKNDTGFSISDISVNFFNVTSIGDEHPNFQIGNVTSSIATSSGNY